MLMRLVLLLLALVVAPAFAVQNPDTPPALPPLAYRLDQSLSVGIVSRDRDLRGEVLEDVLTRITDGSSRSGLAGLTYRPGLRETVGSRLELVTFDSWSKKDQARAESLGVFSVLVIDSIQARRGKPVNVPGSGFDSRGFSYRGLSYKLKFSVECIATPGAASSERPHWRRVSSWQEAADRCKSPHPIDATGIDMNDGARQLTLADVAVHHLDPVVRALNRMNSVASLCLDHPDLEAAYELLSETEREELWGRIRFAWFQGAALPTRSLERIASREWERHADAHFLEAPQLALLVSIFLVNSWEQSPYRKAQGRPRLESAPTAPPKSEGPLASRIADLLRLTAARDQAFKDAQLLPFRYGSSGQPPLVIVSEDCDVADLLQTAPDPAACYAVIRVCDSVGFRSASEARPRLFKQYIGAQLIRLAGDRWVVDRSVSKANLSADELYRLVQEAVSPAWPHEHD